MDHPRALRHAADSETGAAGERLLGEGVGGEDRLGGGLPTVRGEQARGVANAGEHLVERQRYADDAGGRGRHLLGLEPERLRGLRRRRTRIIQPLRARWRRWRCRS